jgi:hypothetical protein
MLPTLLCVYKGETKQVTKMGEQKGCGSILQKQNSA